MWQAVRFKGEYLVIEARETPLTWLIWRYNLRSHSCPIDAQQLAMFNTFQAGQPFSEVCAVVCDFLDEEQVVGFASQTLRQWISEGIFSAFKSRFCIILRGFDLG